MTNFPFPYHRHPGPRAGVPLSSNAALEGSGTPDQVRGDGLWFASGARTLLAISLEGSVG